MIPGQVLSTLTDAIGIKPEAQRVALHRLRKEGWIESQKHGRRSLYGLTEWGLEQSQKASPLIYGPQNRPDRAWLVVSPPGQDEPEVRVAPGVSITAYPPRDPSLLVTEITPVLPVPDWIKERVVDPALRHLSQDTAAAFVQFQTRNLAGPPTTARERAVARVLIVHAWRRIALRQPKLAGHVFPDDWRGAECAVMAQALLRDIGKPGLSELAEAALAV